MRTLTVLILLLAGSAPALASSGEWNFRVLLDGKEIGMHRYMLNDSGADRTLRSEAEFDVRLLSFSLYRYQHEAVERWRDGCLVALDSRTEANGKLSAVQARSEIDGLAVSRADGRTRHSGCIMSFAYWDPRILEATALLNSQTGTLTPVDVSSLGTELRSVQGRQVMAERHRIRGPELEIDLWYADGRWIALEAPAVGGRRLRYELR
jgi:hypothetical protein